MAYKQSPFPMISGTKGHSALKKTWKEAYKTRGSRYKDMSEEAYIAEAKRQKEVHAKTGKWDVKSKEAYQPKKDVKAKVELGGKQTTTGMRVRAEKEAKKLTPKTRAKIKEQKEASKAAGMSRKEIRAQKLYEKAKVAYGKGKTKKAERLAKKVTKKQKLAEGYSRADIRGVEKEKKRQEKLDIKLAKFDAETEAMS